MILAHINVEIRNEVNTTNTLLYTLLYTTNTLLLPKLLTLGRFLPSVHWKQWLKTMTCYRKQKVNLFLLRFFIRSSSTKTRRYPSNNLHIIQCKRFDAIYTLGLWAYISKTLIKRCVATAITFMIIKWRLFISDAVLQILWLGNHILALEVQNTLRTGTCSTEI